MKKPKPKPNLSDIVVASDALNIAIGIALQQGIPREDFFRLVGLAWEAVEAARKREAAEG